MSTLDMQELRLWNMVLNATFNQQYFSYIVTDSGPSRHRGATTKKNKEKHTQKTKTMSNTNHHKTGCEPRCTTTSKLDVNPGVQQHKTGCEPRCSTTSKLGVNPGVQQHNLGMNPGVQQHNLGMNPGVQQHQSWV